MISEAVFTLDGVISRMVRSKGTEEDIRKFKEDLEKYIRGEQRKVAEKLLERVYDNNRQALYNDIKSGEMAKIIIAIDENESVGEIDRKKLLRILYPVLQNEFGIKL